MMINGKHYDIFQPYCERTPSREMVERAGLTWTQGHQDAWDRHQARYEEYLRGRADSLRSEQSVASAQMDEFIAKHRGDLFVGGPLEDCKPLDVTATDHYGGKLRAGKLPGQGWRVQRCLVCGAFTRQWPVPDKDITPKKET